MVQLEEELRVNMQKHIHDAFHNYPFGNVIEESLKVKYLGHIICNDLTDDDDMMRQRRQLYAQGNVISRRFHMCSVEVYNMLFRTFCTPM